MEARGASRRQLFPLSWASSGIRTQADSAELGGATAATFAEERFSPPTGPTPLGIGSPDASSADRSRLGSVIAVVGAGLLMTGAGDAFARTGQQSPVVPLFIAGLIFIFAPCAWRLTGATAARKERVSVSVILGLALLASYIFRSPLIFDGFDELAHQATLMRLLDSRSLFQSNPVLSVSPFYPGIELLTAAVKWLTGLPLQLDQMIVLIVARLVLVLGVFLMVERACGSARAGGIGVLVYAASPEFYAQGAQYGYQTLAIAFAIAIVYLLLASIDTARPRRESLFWLALIAIAGLTLSHHVTSWLTTGFLVVWAAGMRFVSDPQKPTARSGREPFPSGRIASSPSRQRAPVTIVLRREQSKIVGLAALVGVVLTVAWSAFVGHRLFEYVGPVIQAGVSSIKTTLEQGHGNRTLFESSAGGGTPAWESALIWGATVFFCLILLTSLYAVIRKKTVRGGRLRYLPALIAATYPLAMLTSVSSDAKVVGARATTFIFFAMAIVIGGWLARRVLNRPRAIERIVTVTIAVICFLGSTLYGNGPLPALVDGPYIVGAHERSLGAPSLAVANWAKTHLPAGSHIAADRDNGALLNDIGGVFPITPVNGANDPSSLFFDSQLTLSDIAFIRKNDIRYLVTDTRLVRGLPLYGAYIAPSESATPTRLTMAELEKFNSVPGVYRIYDNGAIQVYDLSQLLGKEPLQMSGDLIGTGSTGWGVAVPILASVVALVWLFRLRRLRRRTPSQPVDAHLVVCGMVAAMALGVFWAFAILLVNLPPVSTAIFTLLVLLVLGLRPAGWQIRSSLRWEAPPLAPESIPETRLPEAATVVGRTPAENADPSSAARPELRTRGGRSQLAWGCVGLALFAFGATLATVTARAEWVPPPELSIHAVTVDDAVATVDLGSAAPTTAHLAVVSGGRVVWTAPLGPNSGAQNVPLPADSLEPGARLLLVADGKPIRSVGA